MSAYYTPGAERVHIETHSAYVAAGFCPSVKGKTWCNEKAHKNGPHRAPFLHPDSTRVTSVTWTHAQSEPCPCPPETD